MGRGYYTIRLSDDWHLVPEHIREHLASIQQLDNVRFSSPCYYIPYSPSNILFAIQ